MCESYTLKEEAASKRLNIDTYVINTAFYKGESVNGSQMEVKHL
jgi:hypothetical protein